MRIGLPGPVARVVVAGLLLAISAALPAAAQSYPNRVDQDDSPVSGGQRDRWRGAHIAADLQKSLGQPVIIENQPGADGIIAAQAAKRAAPDGYTLFVSTNSAHGANPTLYKEPAL